MKRPLFYLKDVKKVYKMGDVEVPALKGINLTIEKGEFVAIIGHSGSGKSTLLSIMGCLDKPTEGKFFLDGEDVLKVSDNRLAIIRNQKIGFVFQQFNLLPRMTALENVEAPCIYAGIKRSERIKRAKELLERVGLEKERFYHYSNQLSGGQRQKVAIARALMNNPDIILADEPTGSLDTHSGDELMKIFVQLNEEKRAIILVTHEKYIADFARRIIHLKDGLIEGQNGA